MDHKTRSKIPGSLYTPNFLSLGVKNIRLNFARNYISPRWHHMRSPGLLSVGVVRWKVAILLLDRN